MEIKKNQYYFKDMDYYICETPKILLELIDERKDILKDALVQLKEEQKELILLGSGSSYTAAQTVKYFLQKMTGKIVTLLYPNNVLHYEILNNSSAAVIGISQSGNSVAAIEAITGDQSCVEQTRNAYKERRDAFLTNAKKIGWKIDKTKGTMFIWAKIPDKYKTSFDFVDDLFNQTGILFVPGSAFGSYGEGFVRIALIQDIQTIEKAFSLINKTNIFK